MDSNAVQKATGDRKRKQKKGERRGRRRVPCDTAPSARKGGKESSLKRSPQIRLLQVKKDRRKAEKQYNTPPVGKRSRE